MVGRWLNISLVAGGVILAVSNTGAAEEVYDRKLEQAAMEMVAKRIGNLRGPLKQEFTVEDSALQDLERLDEPGYRKPKAARKPIEAAAPPRPEPAPPVYASTSVEPLRSLPMATSSSIERLEVPAQPLSINLFSLRTVRLIPMPTRSH